MGVDRSTVLQNAQLFASRGQFDAAINEWKKLTSDSPTDGSIYNSIGDLHQRRNAAGDAINAYLQAAAAFRAEGATLKAIAAYKKVLKVDPSRYEIYRHLGDLNAERGLLSSAVQDYLTLGKHYLKERKTREALEIYKKIVHQDPSNLDAQQRVAELCLQENLQDEATKVYLQLGRERSAQQRYDEAKDAYLAVLRIDPSNSEAAQFVENFGKGGTATVPRPATGGGATPSQKSSEPPDLITEAMRRMEEGQYAGAEAILSQLLTREPGNPHVCQLLARVHLLRGDLQVALGEYRFLAGAALRAQDYAMAESLIIEYLTAEPNCVPLLELYGELCEEKGDAALAAAQYGKAVEVLLVHPEPGMPTLHEELFEKVKSLAPDSQLVAALAARLRGAPAPDAETPASELQAPIAAVDPTPDTSGVEVPDEMPGGHEEFTITGAEPDSTSPMPPAIENQHEPVFTIRRAEPDKGVEGPEPAMSADEDVAAAGDPPESPQASADPPPSIREQIAHAVAQNRYADAERLLAQRLNDQPEDVEARHLLGDLYETKGDGPAAAVQYTRVLELLIEQPERMDRDRLQRLYAKVKKLAPASPVVARLGGRFEKAAEPAAPKEASCESPPSTDHEMHYTLGVAYKNMGLLEEAKEEFQTAMKSAEFYLDSSLMTALCLKDQSRVEAAIRELEQLIGDERCCGAKAQAIRYELGLLYEQGSLPERALAIYNTIPTFHDVPQRLESLAQHVNGSNQVGASSAESSTRRASSR